jgi:transposase
LLAAHVTPADERDRAQVERLVTALRAASGESVSLAYVDQGYTGDEPAASAQAHGIRLEVVKHAEAKRGFVLLPRRPPWPAGHGPCGDGAGAGWVVERSFAWATRFRRLAKDHERPPAMLAGLHFLAFACLMVQKAVPLLASSP